MAQINAMRTNFLKQKLIIRNKIFYVDYVEKEMKPWIT